MQSELNADEKEKMMIAKRIKFVVRKNKVSPDGRQGGVRLIVTSHNGFQSGDFDQFSYITTMLESFGRIRKDGNKHYYLSEQFTSRAALLAYIKNTPGVLDEAIEFIMLENGCDV